MVGSPFPIAMENVKIVRQTLETKNAAHILKCKYPPFQEHIYLEMGGNDDGEGEDEDLKVVQGVVHIRPVDGAEKSDYLPVFAHFFLPR